MIRPGRIARNLDGKAGLTIDVGPIETPDAPRRASGLSVNREPIPQSFTLASQNGRWKGAKVASAGGKRMNQLVEPEETPDLACLRLAYATSFDCIATLGLDGTLLTLNDKGAATLGGEIARGSAWADLWIASDRDAARAAVSAAGRGERTTLRTAGGSAAFPHPRFWDSVLTAVPGPNGTPGRLLAVSRDVTERYEAARALDHLGRLQHALIEATSEIVWHLDGTTGITTRRGHLEFTGHENDPHDIDGWLSTLHPDDRARAKLAADQALVDRAPSTIEYRLLHRTGAWRWVEDHATPILDEAGVVTDWVGIITDIHDRKTAERALQKNAEHLRLAVEANGLGTWDVNLVNGEREWSAEMFDLLRLPRDAVPYGDMIFNDMHPDDVVRFRREFHGPGLLEAGARTCTFRLLFPDGDERWIEAHERVLRDQDGVPLRRVGTWQDITARKRADLEVWRAAHTDAVTGIANRTLFQLRLDQAIAEAEAGSTGIGLILVDLDRFKEVNDTFGHDAGDLLLRSVAERLSLEVPADATVVRLGGDEFGVLLPATAQVELLTGLAARLLEALKRPMPYAGHQIESSVSIGWSVYPGHDDQAGALLKNADIALYAAKAAGRGRALAYTAAMRAELQRRVGVLRAARDALARDAVLPYYQPKIALDTGAVVGFEALLRWTDEGRLRSPGAIQEALDHPDLSVQLGARMLERIVADMQVWTADQLPFGHVALNVAAPEFGGGGYAERVLGALRRGGLRPCQLEIEVTERVLLDDGSDAIETALRTLHEAGVRIALDDFGTGFASLTHLVRFPVAVLKIDRSFVSNLQAAGTATAITIAIIELAHQIGIRTVAEGIECDEQRRLLAASSCDFGQGYLFAKPMPASRVPHFIKHRRGRASAHPTAFPVAI